MKDKAQFCYFNSGVLLLNLKRLREDGYDIQRFKDVYQELLAICRKTDPKRESPYYQDQGILNYLFGVDAYALS